MAALARMNFPEERLLTHIPLVVNDQVFQRNSQPRLEAAVDLKSKSAFLAFLPSRILMGGGRVDELGQTKHSEIAIEGFARFLSELPEVNRNGAFLLIPVNEASRDLPLARDLIDRLGIASNVIWLTGASNQALSRTEMIDAYSVSDAVLDDFGAGWYGSVVVEAASCETAIITHVADETLATVSPHPFILATSREEVARALLLLFSDPNLKSSLGSASRRWVQTFHSVDAVRAAYDSLLQGLRPSRFPGPSCAPTRP